MAEQATFSADGSSRAVEPSSSNGSRDHAIPQSVSASEEMLSLLVHELRNPLAVLKGFAETIENSAEQLEREVLVSSARAMRRATGHLEDLVESLGDIRTLFSDDVQISLQPVRLGELVASTVHELEMVGDGRSIELEIEDDIELQLDPVRVRQILTNLIENAYKFSPDDRPIKISVSRAENKADICVVDEGPGIPPGREEEVFRKFSRLDTDVEGSGLGLFISRAIARAHGGDLTVGDEDGGCRFVLELPLEQGAQVIRLDEG